MSAKRLDLDAALAELDEDDEPLEVTLFEEKWLLPGSIPAAVLLRIQSWQEDGFVDDDGQPTDELTVGQCLGLLRDMVPADILEEWFARGLTARKYARAVDHIMKSYSLVEQAEQMAAGKAGPRTGAKGTNRAGRRSSSTGRSSKPTSSGSTGSRSLKR